MKGHKIESDMEAALNAFREGEDITGKDEVLAPLIKQLTEAAMKYDKFAKNL